MTDLYSHNFTTNWHVSCHRKKQWGGRLPTNMVHRNMMRRLAQSKARIVTNACKFRRTCGDIVEDDRVQGIILGAIVANSVMLGMGTFDFDDPRVRMLLDSFDFGFLLLFTAELALQLFHKGLHMLKDGWACFDAAVVVFSWSLEKLQIARALRILRAVRLVTHLESLRTVLAALLRVLPRLYSVAGLFVILLYIYAVLCTELFSDLYARGVTDDDYFGTLGQSLFTLFQFVTAENWNAIARQVNHHYYWARFVFGSFVITTNIVMYSLLAAVFCHAVAEPDKKAEEAVEAFERVQRRILESQEKQILVLCQCQVLMPHEDLAVFSPERSKKKLTRQVSFQLRKMPAGPNLGDTHSPDGNNSTLSILSDNIIEFRDEKFERVKTFRERCKEFGEDPKFQLLSAALIVLNGISLGVETFDFVDNSEMAQRIFRKMNRGFLVIFTLELAFNLYVAGHLRRCIRDPWLCFDFIVVAVCWAVESLSIARALRVIRVFRVSRRFKPLQELIEALGVATPGISGVLFFFVLILYIYCVFCTVLFGELFETESNTDFDYFGRLDKTLFTLFQMLTLEGWGSIVREVAADFQWAWLVFCSYLIITSAVLFSMIIGFMTDAVKKRMSHRELDQRSRHLHRQLQLLNGQQKTLLRTIQHCISHEEKKRRNGNV